MSSPSTPVQAIEYPEDDGLPMSDNTLQGDWIMAIKVGLDAAFAADPDVFVAANLLWYPVEGDNTTRLAPDGLVAFGRPKGRRGSYRQWEEGGIAPQVVFEVLSPGNRPGALREKFDFYQRHGVEEYYIYDPDEGTLEGWLRHDDQLQPIDQMRGWVSPRMGVRFDLVDGELELFEPNGRKFASYAEIVTQRADAEKEARRKDRQLKREKRRADEAAQRSDEEKQRAEKEKQRAEKEKQRAEKEKQRAEKEKQQREQAEQALERLRAQLLRPGR